MWFEEEKERRNQPNVKTEKKEDLWRMIQIQRTFPDLFYRRARVGRPSCYSATGIWIIAAGLEFSSASQPL